MFLQFAPLGAVVPFLALHLKHLGIPGETAALVWAAQALASFLAPVPAGQIADRWMPADRCQAFSSLISAGFLWFLADVREPAVFIPVYFLLWIFWTPTVTLG